MQPFRGILSKLISVTAFVLMAACIKAAAEDVPAGEAVFFRSFFALPIVLGWLAWQGKLSVGLKVVNPVSHIWRGTLGTSGMGLRFAGLGLLPLPESVAISYVTPLLVVMFAGMFLGERVGPYRLSAVFLGMVGVAIVLSPRLTVLSTPAQDLAALGAMLILMSSCFAALAQVFIRKMVQTEQTSAIVFWFTITSTGLSLLTLPFGWVVPEHDILALLIAAGLLGGIGQLFLTSAYRFSDASLVAPFEYTSMLLSLVVGYVVFREVPTGTMLGGAALVIVAGVIIILRERYLGLKRGKARPNMSQ